LREKGNGGIKEGKLEQGKSRKVKKDWGDPSVNEFAGQLRNGDPRGAA